MVTNSSPPDDPASPPRGGLLRWAGVRLTIGLLTVLVAVVGMQLALRLTASVPALSRLLHMTRLLFVLPIAAGVAAYVLYVHQIEHRPVRELSVRGAGSEWARGALLGSGMFALTIGILALVGSYHLSGPVRWEALWTMLPLAAFAAVLEEILFRGLIFRVTEEGLGTAWALAISAAVFGGVHFLNPHSGVFPAVALMIEAGVFLAAAFLWTRRLWFAIGAHFAWNFTESGIFGVSVSGGRAEGLWHGTLSGPAWLSGGEFGAESSVVAVAVCVSVSVYLLARVRQRGGWQNRTASAPDQRNF